VEFSADVTGAAFPVTIDPDFAGSTADGSVYGVESGTGSFAAARATSRAFSTVDTVANLGIRLLSSFRYVYRNFLKFDTSSIPDTDTITQVNLKLVATADSSANDFDVQIVKQDWSGQDPITADNREAIYDNCLSGTADSSIWENTADISVNTQYASGNLATDWVSKTGYTYYSLRSSNDYNNVESAGYITIATSENATESYRPVLSVTYTGGSTFTGNPHYYYAQL